MPPSPKPTKTEKRARARPRPDSAAPRAAPRPTPRAKGVAPDNAQREKPSAMPAPPLPAEVREGQARLLTHPEVFFNPHMRLCRDLSSLWVGTLPPLERTMDAFCASGARGVRYALENENVQAVELLDASPQAAELARRNLAFNAIPPARSRVVCEPLHLHFAKEWEYDLVEIDPFGTPQPFLAPILRAGRQKRRYVSITATDTAVLCGAKAAACLKVYGARPLDNEFCHENAVRILLGQVARMAASENWATHPEICFSHRHYVKLMLRLEQGAPGAVESVKRSLNQVSHCPQCLHHEMAQRPEEMSGACPNCGGKLTVAGPMWGGPWADAAVAGRMRATLRERPYYERAEETDALLATIEEEAPGPALTFDLHELASRHKRQIPKVSDAVEGLRAMGFWAAKTHYSSTSLRTDAGVADVLGAMRPR